MCECPPGEKKNIEKSNDGLHINCCLELRVNRLRVSLTPSDFTHRDREHAVQRNHFILSFTSRAGA